MASSDSGNNDTPASEYLPSQPDRSSITDLEAPRTSRRGRARIRNTVRRFATTDTHEASKMNPRPHETLGEGSLPVGRADKRKLDEGELEVSAKNARLGQDRDVSRPQGRGQQTNTASLPIARQPRPVGMATTDMASGPNPINASSSPSPTAAETRPMVRIMENGVLKAYYVGGPGGFKDLGNGNFRHPITRKKFKLPHLITTPSSTPDQSASISQDAAKSQPEAIPQIDAAKTPQSSPSSIFQPASSGPRRVDVSISTPNPFPSRLDEFSITSERVTSTRSTVSGLAPIIAQLGETSQNNEGRPMSELGQRIEHSELGSRDDLSQDDALQGEADEGSTHFEIPVNQPGPDVELPKGWFWPSSGHSSDERRQLNEALELYTSFHKEHNWTLPTKSLFLDLLRWLKPLTSKSQALTSCQLWKTRDLDLSVIRIWFLIIRYGQNAVNGSEELKVWVESEYPGWQISLNHPSNIMPKSRRTLNQAEETDPTTSKFLYLCQKLGDILEVVRNPETSSDQTHDLESFIQKRPSLKTPKLPSYLEKSLGNLKAMTKARAMKKLHELAGGDDPDALITSTETVEINAETLFLMEYATDYLTRNLERFLQASNENVAACEDAVGSKLDTTKLAQSRSMCMPKMNEAVGDKKATSIVIQLSELIQLIDSEEKNLNNRFENLAWDNGN
ncbi:hypothetical protein HJFPF1_05453 [Paramyrothecium foliicola]|nr:hypothetical protein HJFPF1_05453 [Paramyrothecium foliicola]